MANSSKIVLYLKDSQGPRAPFTDFTIVSSALRNCLVNLARCIGEGDVEFSISGLEYSSVLLELEPEKLDNGAGKISDLFLDTIDALQEGRPLDKRIDYPALHCFNGFTGAVKNKRLTLQFNSVVLTSSYARNITALLEPSMPSLGSVSGKLEAVNIHNENRFFLYPAIPGEQIACVFNNNQLEDVLKAVAHNVTVSGTLYYAQSKILPVRVEVESFEVNPPDDELSNLLDSRGAFLKHPPIVVDANLMQDYANDWW